MNNTNIIEKIIKNRPKDVFVVYYHRGINEKKCLVAICATMNKALERVTSHFLKQRLDRGYFQYRENYGYIYELVNEKLYTEIFKKKIDYKFIFKFWDKLSKTIKNECKDKKHTNEEMCESCEKTKTYLHIYTNMKNYIQKYIDKNNTFRFKGWAYDHYFEDVYHIETRTLMQ